MGFEEGALHRLRRYRTRADQALALMGEAEEAARRFAERLFESLEYVAGLGRRAGFDIEAVREGNLLTLLVAAGPGAGSRVVFGVVRGAAAETHEDLMHEQLSSYLLDPSGYSGRIVGCSENVGEGPCQVFAIYRDGVWKTRGVLVERARGKIDDPDEVLNGFSLRVLGRVIDLAAPTEWAGRRWADGPYTVEDLLRGERFFAETRWLR